VLININYHIWFKVCKSVKFRYRMSTNDLLILNGCYLLHLTTNKPFTLNKIYSFVTYYNKPKIQAYIKRLIERKFIIQSVNHKGYPLYNISPLGLQVIEDLNNSYDVEMGKFCSLYGISL